MPLIRVADDVFRRLQKHATPLVDSTNDVLRRVLDAYEGLRVDINPQSPSDASTTLPNSVPAEFSMWTAWGGRDHLEGSNLPGLYILGNFDGVPPKEVDPLAPEVIYIGITERQTLRKRWEQFAASAFSKQLGHSGGVTFNERYCASEPCGPPAWLYVAAMPAGKERIATIRPLKQQLLAGFSARHGALPSCNSRGG